MNSYWIHRVGLALKASVHKIHTSYSVSAILFLRRPRTFPNRFVKCHRSSVSTMTQPSKRAQQLMKPLGHFPLALVQATAMIRERGLSIPDFQELLSKAEHEVLQFNRTDRPESRSVYATWDISMNYITQAARNDGSDIAKGALDLLRLMLFLDCRGIPLRMFMEAAKFGKCRKHLNCLQHDSVLHVTGLPLPHVMQYSATMGGKGLMARFNEVVTYLKSFNLIQTSESAVLGICITIHPLVHRWARHRFHQNPIIESEYLRKALCLIGMVSHGLPATYARQLSCELHLQSCSTQGETSRQEAPNDFQDRLRKILNDFIDEYGATGEHLSVHILLLFAQNQPLRAKEVAKSLLHNCGGGAETEQRFLEVLRNIAWNLHQVPEAYELDLRLLGIVQDKFGSNSCQAHHRQLCIVQDLGALGKAQSAAGLLKKLTAAVNTEPCPCGLHNSCLIEEVRLDLQEYESKDRGLAAKLSAICSLNPCHQQDQPYEKYNADRMLYPGDLVENFKQLHECLGRGDNPEAFEEAWIGYEASLQRLGPSHPLTERFLKALSEFEPPPPGLLDQLDMTKRQKYEIASCLVPFSSSGGVPTWLRISNRFGGNNPTTILAMLRCSIMTQNSSQDIDTSRDLLHRARLLSQSPQFAQLYGNRLDISIRWKMIASLLNFGEKHKDRYPSLSEEMNLLAFEDSQQLMSHSKQQYGTYSPDYCGSFFVLAMSLYHCGDYRQSCQTCASIIDICNEVLSSLDVYDKGLCLHMHCLIHDAQSLLLTATARMIQSQCRDPGAGAVLAWIKDDLHRREYISTKTHFYTLSGPWLEIDQSCEDLEALRPIIKSYYDYPNGMVTCLFRYIGWMSPHDHETCSCTVHSKDRLDKIAAERLTKYWEYRTRCDEYFVEDIREAAIAPKTPGQLQELLGTLTYIVMPFDSDAIGVDWEGDLQTLSKLMEDSVGQACAEHGSLSQKALSQMHDLVQIYSRLTSTRRCLESAVAELDIIQLFVELSQPNAYHCQNCLCDHRPRARELQRLLEGMQRNRIAMPERVAEALFHVTTDITMFFASGLVWDGWADGMEWGWGQEWKQDMSYLMSQMWGDMKQKGKGWIQRCSAKGSWRWPRCRKKVKTD